ncbi:MAG: DUF4129 domain-containing protein [Halobacteriaceae archaeon]
MSVATTGRSALGTAVIAAVLLAVVAASLTTPIPGVEEPDQTLDRNRGGGSPGGGIQDPQTGGQDTVDVPVVGISIRLDIDLLPGWLLIALIGLGAAAAIAGFVVSIRDLLSRDRVEVVEELEADETPDRSAAAVGDAAGRAADRLLADTDAAITNEVYRAYLEMTRPLAVENPASSTPREFGTAAIDAGLDPEDVETLTSLFERVRYGAEPLTDADRDRVVAVLRRIEATYADTEEPEE